MSGAWERWKSIASISSGKRTVAPDSVSPLLEVFVSYSR